MCSSQLSCKVSSIISILKWGNRFREGEWPSQCHPDTEWKFEPKSVFLPSSCPFQHAKSTRFLLLWSGQCYSVEEWFFTRLIFIKKQPLIPSYRKKKKKSVPLLSLAPNFNMLGWGGWGGGVPTATSKCPTPARHPIIQLNSVTIYPEAASNSTGWRLNPTRMRAHCPNFRCQ